MKTAGKILLKVAAAASFTLPFWGGMVGFFIFKRNIIEMTGSFSLASLASYGLGKALLGSLLLLIGAIYALFGAKESNKQPAVMVVIGAAMIFIGNFTQIIGAVIMVIPLSYLAGKKLWEWSSLEKKLRGDDGEQNK